MTSHIIPGKTVIQGGLRVESDAQGNVTISDEEDASRPQLLFSEAEALTLHVNLRDLVEWRD